MWSLFLFISTTAYYTSDYMHRGQQESERMERFVYDPKVTPLIQIRIVLVFGDCEMCEAKNSVLSATRHERE